MGYICPDCGEGLPEDELCPCQSGDPEDYQLGRGVGRRSLTAELDDSRSQVREFLAERFSIGLRELQRRYRQSAPPARIPRNDANPGTVGTVGTAADWLLRFLVHPEPDVTLALIGSGLIPQRSHALAVGITELCGALGVKGVMSLQSAASETASFMGPVPGSTVDAELLARGCWALALLTEFYRAGPLKAVNSPVARLRSATAADLLTLATPAALDQLAQIREVFETVLVPRLTECRGLWALGPTFAGSALMGGADADLVAARLLVEIKTTAKAPSLGIVDLFQMIGYVLLDFDDYYEIDSIALFSTRYGYFTEWPVNALLDELAGRAVDLARVRDDFRQMLLAQH